MTRLHAPPRLALAFIALLAAGCSVAPTRDASRDFAANQQLLGALTQWRVEGKIGLRHGEQGDSALLNWRQRGDAYAIRLSGPLGLGAVQIDGDAQQVTVRTADGSHSAASPEQLVARLTGWQIPIGALKYWARGLPDPDLPIAEQQVSDGRLSLLRQGGWSIEFNRYTQVDGYPLPARIVMTRPATRLTLLFKSWRLS